jgi:hypothetical protein
MLRTPLGAFTVQKFPLSISVRFPGTGPSPSHIASEALPEFLASLPFTTFFTTVLASLGIMISIRLVFLHGGSRNNHREALLPQFFLAAAVKREQSFFHAVHQEVHDAFGFYGLLFSYSDNEFLFLHEFLRGIMQLFCFF